MKVKNIITLLLLTTFISCNSNEHDNKENGQTPESSKDSLDSIAKYQEKSKEILKISKEGADFIMQGMKIEMKDSIKAAGYYRKALDKFLTAVALDTTRKKIGIYLPDLYGKLNMLDSMLFWKNWLGPEYK